MGWIILYTECRTPFLLALSPSVRCGIGCPARSGPGSFRSARLGHGPVAWSASQPVWSAACSALGLLFGPLDPGSAVGPLGSGSAVWPARPGVCCWSARPWVCCWSARPWVCCLVRSARGLHLSVSGLLAVRSWSAARLGPARPFAPGARPVGTDDFLRLRPAATNEPPAGDERAPSMVPPHSWQ